MKKKRRLNVLFQPGNKKKSPSRNVQVVTVVLGVSCGVAVMQKNTLKSWKSQLSTIAGHPIIGAHFHSNRQWGQIHSSPSRRHHYWICDCNLRLCVPAAAGSLPAHMLQHRTAVTVVECSLLMQPVHSLFFLFFLIPSLKRSRVNAFSPVTLNQAPNQTSSSPATLTLRFALPSNRLWERRAQDGEIDQQGRLQSDTVQPLLTSARKKKKTCTKTPKTKKPNKQHGFGKKARSLFCDRAGPAGKKTRALAPSHCLTQPTVLWTRETCSSSGCRQPFNNAWTREGGNQYRYTLTCYIRLHVRMFPCVVCIAQGLASVPSAHLILARWAAAKVRAKAVRHDTAFRLTFRFVYINNFCVKKEDSGNKFKTFW